MAGFGRKGLARPPVQSGEKRSGNRSPARLSAVLETPAAKLSVALVNASAGGVCVKGAELPKVGRFAKLKVGSVTAFGEIVWQDGGACVLRFDKKLSEEEMEEFYQAVQESTDLGMSVEQMLAINAWLNGL
ncbi:hypothetical protein GCM10023208_15410 [Erythrobacter westpacificensis]|uniref:PilZ domain-containing protein n=1 Tax=Erythrobacter westpacificensis TaxID=1055231 RepID=A0ABP9K8A0_9SPHN